MTREDTHDDGLDDRWRDRLVAIGKGVAGAIPLAGGIVAEVVGMVIPGQRADRIATYLRELDGRINELAEEVGSSIASDAEKIALIEEGGFQSARAISRMRIDQIVEAVSRGLDEGSAEIVRRKRILTIFGELDDDEVALLNAYGRSYAGSDRQAFEQIRQPPRAHLQSPMIDIERNRLFEVGREHLVRAGLLKKNYGSVKKGQIPDFDTKTGDFKHTLEVSHLGRMLLREIGLETPFDAQRTNRTTE